MKRITFLPLALFIALSLQPLPLFAQDQDQNRKDAKDAESAHHKSKDKPNGAKQVQKKQSPGDVARNDNPQARERANNTANARRSINGTAQSTSVVNRNVQQTDQRQSYQSQTTSVSVQGNRSNQYNGQWVAGGTHSDWDRNSYHNWNNRNYRWYDGGWLIINVGASPGYYQSDSMVIRVKQSLAQQGYYNGHFTDTVGPHTRQAISNYQSDKGLQVNGQIDGPLLASLGLE